MWRALSVPTRRNYFRQVFATTRMIALMELAGAKGVSKACRAMKQPFMLRMAPIPTANQIRLVKPTSAGRSAKGRAVAWEWVTAMGTVQAVN
jgi:hypothetical protein